MRSSEWLANENGSTLIEAMVAIVILTIGIFAAMTMQVKAIDASSSALNRTDANNVALALLETLKQLDFNDPNLAETIASPGALAQDANDRTFTAATFPEMQGMLRKPGGTPTGTVVDNTGITYQLSWDVQNFALPSGEILNKTIRVYMSWNSLMGRNRLEMTTLKYKNVSL